MFNTVPTAYLQICQIFASGHGVYCTGEEKAAIWQEEGLAVVVSVFFRGKQ